MRYVENKRVVIFKYEIGLSQLLLKAGFRLRALNPYRDLTGAVPRPIAVGHRAASVVEKHSTEVVEIINAGIPLNPDALFLGRSGNGLQLSLHQARPARKESGRHSHYSATGAARSPASATTPR
ncbi:MAG: hypothetical protein WDN69_14870 [Aliidongia sp.]